MSKVSSSSSLYLGTQPDIKNFMKWAKKREIFLHPDVAFLVPTKTMGLGVYAMKPLKKGSTVIGCPLLSAVSPYEKTSAECPSAAVIDKQTSLSTTERVCLRLLAELARPTSPWRPWLECCPRMDVHLFECPDSLINELLYTKSSDGKEQLSWNNVAQEWDNIHLRQSFEHLQAVMNSHPEMWPASVNHYGAFCACMTQIMSRNFHREEIKGQEGPYLLPGVDFINHSFSHTNAEFTMHGGGRNRALTFDVMTTRDIAQGEQIYYHYGPLNNARYFIEFQFVNETNPFDAIRFSLETLATLCAATKTALVSSNEAEPMAVIDGVVLTDMTERVKQLHKFGLLVDEGLLLHTCEFMESEDEIAARQKQKMSGPYPLPDLSKKEVRPFMGIDGDLWNIVYLVVVCDESTFNDILPKLSHHWEFPRTEGNHVKRAMLKMLELRKASIIRNVEFASQKCALQGEEVVFEKKQKLACEMLLKVLRREITALDAIREKLTK